MGPSCKSCGKKFLGIDEIVKVKSNPVEDIFGDYEFNNSILVCMDCAEDTIKTHLSDEDYEMWLMYRNRHLDYLQSFYIFSDDFTENMSFYNSHKSGFQREAPRWENDFCRHCGYKWSTMWLLSVYGGLACQECSAIAGLHNEIRSIERDLNNIEQTLREKEETLLLEIDNLKKQNVKHDVLDALLHSYSRLNISTLENDLNSKLDELRDEERRVELIKE